MKILWLSHNVPYPPVGGVLQRNFHLLREVAAHHRVHLVALRQRELCPDEEALEAARHELATMCEAVDILPLPWDESVAHRAQLAARAMAPGGVYDVMRFHSPACHALLRRLGRQPFDLMHLDTVGLVPYRRWLPARAVLNHHNVESTMMERRTQNEPSLFKRTILHLQAARLRDLETRWAGRVAVNLMVSALDEDRLLRIVPHCRTEVIPNGVDETYFDAPVNDDPAARTIVFVGSHKWYPNRDAAVFFLQEIWPRILERQSEARFVLIGGSPCREALAAAERDSRVQVRGFVPDLRDEVAAAAVFVAPFRQGGGTRLKLLDALAMRKAIVTTTMGAEGLPLRDRVDCLIADDPADFARRVVELIASPATRREIGQRGRALVEESFAWSKVGARLRQVVAAAAESAPSPPVPGREPA